MKESFLWIMAIFVPAGFAVWLAWAGGKLLWGIYEDWKLHNDLEELKKHRSRESSAAPDESPKSPDYTSKL